MTVLDTDDLKKHIGRTQTATDVLSPGPANLLRLAFARPGPELKEAADGHGAELWAVTPEGTIAMSAEVEFAA